MTDLLIRVIGAQYIVRRVAAEPVRLRRWVSSLILFKYIITFYFMSPVDGLFERNNLMQYIGLGGLPKVNFREVY